VGDFSGFWKSAALEILLDLGADPNVLDNHGLSCLHKASSSPERMKTLLQKGADISIRKVSPLFTAIHAQDIQALAIILDAGGDPNSKDVDRAGQEHYKMKGPANRLFSVHHFHPCTDSTNSRMTLHQW
jgi:ankyrin repeat protein